MDVLELRNFIIGCMAAANGIVTESGCMVDGTEADFNVVTAEGQKFKVVITPAE